MDPKFTRSKWKSRTKRSHSPKSQAEVHPGGTRTTRTVWSTGHSQPEKCKCKTKHLDSSLRLPSVPSGSPKSTSSTSSNGSGQTKRKSTCDEDEEDSLRKRLRTEVSPTPPLKEPERKVSDGGTQTTKRTCDKKHKAHGLKSSKEAKFRRMGKRLVQTLNGKRMGKTEHLWQHRRAQPEVQVDKVPGGRRLRSDLCWVSHHGRNASRSRSNTTGSTFYPQLLDCETRSAVDLVHYINKHKEDDTIDCKNIFRQLVDATIDLHSKGIFHRDIKCDNVLVELGTDKVWLIDFGSATYFKPGQKFSDPQGTAAYSSPEWFREHEYSAEPTTAWQLGLVLYGLLFNTVPLVREESIGSLRKVPVPRSISDELRDLLQGCLEKNPADRLSLQQIRNHPWLNPK
ncbi:hypothetical protein WMY93_010032 [Mugilogobius chulae]|uniref:Serine/threonine-protein kinase 1 n=1 Tax=Mugilogobius chulae TaxID=88201 RepID=A0AAW0PCH8_9GOBI